MSRFADPAATRELDLGPCQCPGTPHDRDNVTYRYEFGDGELESIGSAGVDPDGGPYDYGKANDRMLALAVVSWNLVTGQTLPDGRPVPVAINSRTMSLLDHETRDAISIAVDRAKREAEIPKPPTAPSQDSSQESGSPTPIAPKGA